MRELGSTGVRREVILAPFFCCPASQTVGCCDVAETCGTAATGSTGFAIRRSWGSRVSCLFSTRYIRLRLPAA